MICLVFVFLIVFLIFFFFFFNLIFRSKSIALDMINRIEDAFVDNLDDVEVLFFFFLFGISLLYYGDEGIIFY